MSEHPPRIGLVSLGCPKALVDSERIITRLRAEGYALSGDYAGADLVIVNTCGFLDSARAESLEAIAEALRENGRVIVTGCMGVDAEEIRKAHPQVLAITGPQDFAAVMDAVHAACPAPHDFKKDLVPEAGLRLTPRHYAWLKISEGCSNSCTFCIIPRLRGPLASRPASDILREAEALARAGVREIMVISQDTSAWGRDLRHAEEAWQGRSIRAHITDLARELGHLGIWVRLMYVYPYPHVDGLVKLMAEGLILPYLDLPLQHAAPSVLRAMKRPADEEKMLRRIEAWRKICPDIAIRSTFITGFPGEREEDFDHLLQWLQAAQLDRVGAFAFEDVAGAPASALPGAVPRQVREERRARLMQLQEQISAARLRRKVGRTIDVLVDEVDESEGLIIARTPWDAPEVDGEVWIGRDQAPRARPGDMMKVRITDALTHDLAAEPVSADRADRAVPCHER